jgi:hypothetical protein
MYNETSNDIGIGRVAQITSFGVEELYSFSRVVILIIFFFSFFFAQCFCSRKLID